MPSISLTLPTAGTVITAGLHATNYTTLQTLLNGGLDTANWASGKIFPPSKLTQEGATNAQVLAWDNGTSTWKPTTQSSAPGYATTLPGSPADGQEAVLVDSITLPTYQWRFRWNAGSSNADKWEFIGGTFQRKTLANSDADAGTGAGTWFDLGTVFSQTMARGGVYAVIAKSIHTGSVNPSKDRIGIVSGAGTPAATDTGGSGPDTTGGSTQRGAVAMAELTVAAAGDIRVRYIKDVAETLTRVNVSMQITPIRVS